MPSALKMTPRYIFVKYVAGLMGEHSIEKLLAMEELIKCKADVSYLVYGEVLLGAILEANIHMEQCCREYRMRCPDWKKIVEGKNPTYFADFARLTASYTKLAQCRALDRIVATRLQAKIDIDLIQAKTAMRRRIQNVATQ
jgi:hypothetical protein